MTETYEGCGTNDLPRELPSFTLTRDKGVLSMDCPIKESPFTFTICKPTILVKVL